MPIDSFRHYTDSLDQSLQPSILYPFESTELNDKVKRLTLKYLSVRTGVTRNKVQLALARKFDKQPEEFSGIIMDLLADSQIATFKRQTNKSVSWCLSINQPSIEV